MKHTRRGLARFAMASLAALTLMGPAAPLWAGSADPTPETIVMTVTYEDGSGRDMRELTLGEVMELPVAGFETSTVWTEGVQRFDGVWLEDLIAHLGLSEGTLELSALNEYLVDFKADEIPGNKALVAYRHNGNLMSAREKGPLWIVYPYDEGPEFQTELTFMSSIWQLDRIVALP